MSIIDTFSWKLKIIILVDILFFFTLIIILSICGIIKKDTSQIVQLIVHQQTTSTVGFIPLNE